MMKTSNTSGGRIIDPFIEPIAIVVDRIMWTLDNCNTQKALGNRLQLSQPAVSQWLKKIAGGRLLS